MGPFQILVLKAQGKIITEALPQRSILHASVSINYNLKATK